MVSTNGRPTTGEIASVDRDYPGLTYAADFLRHNDKTLLTRGNGKRVTELYREVERDPRVYAVLQQRYAAVLGREVVVEPASNKSQDKKAARLVEEQIKQLNNRAVQVSDKSAIYTLGGFEYFSACMLDAILIGYSVAEIDWAIDDGVIYPRQIWARDAGRFRFNVASGGYELRLLTWSDAVGETLPPRKFLINSFGSRDGNPYGLGLGSTLFWPWWFKKNAIKFWLTYADKFGSPTLKGTYQNENQKHKLLHIMRDAQGQAGVALPEGVVLDLLSAPGGSTSTYETLCNYCDQLLTLCVLNQNLTSNISSGSYAASETHMEVREELTDADAAMLTDGPYRDLANWITFYNVPDAQPPLVYRPRSKVINNDRASRDEILSRIMQRPLDEEYIKLHYDVTFQKVEEQQAESNATPFVFNETIDAAKIGTLNFKAEDKQRNCKTGYACGGTCISKGKKCKQKLDGDAIKAADYLEDKVPKGKGKPKKAKTSANGGEDTSPPLAAMSVVGDDDPEPTPTTKPKSNQPKSTKINSVELRSTTTTSIDRSSYNERITDEGGSRLQKHKKYLKEAKKEFPNPPPYPEEVAALKWYTDEGYHDMNKILRGKTDGYRQYQIDDAIQETRLAEAALQYLPTYQGTVYRGVQFTDKQELQRVVNQYKVGKTVTEKAFTSTSSAGLLDEFEGQLNFVVTSKTGKSVKQTSARPKEDEVLFPSKTKFKVLKVDNESGTTLIYLEEI